MVVLKSGHRELLQILKDNTCRSLVEIAEKMGCHHRTIRRYLLTLEAEDLIEIDRENWKEVTVKAVTVLEEGT